MCLTPGGPAERYKGIDDSMLPVELTEEEMDRETRTTVTATNGYEKKTSLRYGTQ